ncbi:MAG: hypothetical protein AVDCRST_MAG74-2902 [uncultured Pyrinomonadaceae bacterium]|uniref:Uncharacterized protein n=1 Tax=uncultured Pyrinomonadaceae bacterium TaxID=2283094 RepID=A0A6J4PMG6_9BACT|nr:MAG: hypothetical protein AVDCRST_MAG74-2902 [uncultured Pyrinomonadaceae bacterium]
MLKIFYAIILTLILMPTVWAQEEAESAVSSRLVDVSLPGGAQRILPGRVPAEVKQTLEKMVAAVGEKARQGETEVLVWAGASYKKANAPTIVYRLTDTLKVDGWQYEVAGEESGVTIFSLVKDKGGRRAVMGFYGATDDALVFAWTEILPAAKQTETVQNNRTNRIEDAPVAKSGASNDIVGTWTNGNVSTLQEKNLTTGAIASRGGSTFKYVFTADGRFEFIGLMQSTVYGCTTSLFNDKRGKYEINGSNITFIPSKNFWRNTYSCSPASNKERDYVLERETYEFRTKTDEYGKTLVCLANAKGESCYRREE